MRFAFAPLSAFSAPLLSDDVAIAGELLWVAWMLDDLYKKLGSSPYV
jgi:hypothetical protein